MEILAKIPKDFIYFLMTTLFALIIGLEQRRRHDKTHPVALFGTDRTYALIGILGFILYVISPENLLLFIIGEISLLILLAVFYIKKIEKNGYWGLTSITLVLITYNVAPLVYTQPLWLTVLIFTIVLILVEMKERLKILSKKFDEKEFITLSKFLLISGVILPLLPQNIINDLIPISPFKFWLAIVVVSGVSYFSYLLQKFIFPQKGIIITSILGGLYSSTATTIVLARKSRLNTSSTNQITAGIIIATGMMFLRLLLLAYIFNPALTVYLLPSFSILVVISSVVSLVLYKFSKQTTETNENSYKGNNPLEFKTALIFAGLFIVFAVITKYVLEYYGTKGLNILSVVVGVTDIDPFLLSLFMGKYSISLQTMADMTLLATLSNNVVKLVYGLSFGDKKIRKPLIIGFLTIIVLGILLLLI
jgi:uncharacterized membrane protein (DUF4010 family)